jgi:hypothetical protein
MTTLDKVIYLAVIAGTVEKKKLKRKIIESGLKKKLLKRVRFSHIDLLEDLKFYPEDRHNYLHMDEVTHLNVLSMVSSLTEKGHPHETSNIAS